MMMIHFRGFYTYIPSFFLFLLLYIYLNDNYYIIFLDDMGKNRCDNRQRPLVMLDAGYVSIRPNDVCKSSKIIGLHGKKLLCIVLIIVFLFLFIFINLTVS
jgi:hypothetical protein